MHRETAVRLAVGTRDRLVQVWTVDSSFGITIVFNIELKTTVPKSITLVDNAARDVLVYGIFDGKM